MTIRRPLSVMIAATWLALATPVAADCDMTRSAHRHLVVRVSSQIQLTR